MTSLIYRRNPVRGPLDLLFKQLVNSFLLRIRGPRIIEHLKNMLLLLLAQQLQFLHADVRVVHDLFQNSKQVAIHSLHICPLEHDCIVLEAHAHCFSRDNDEIEIVVRLLAKCYILDLESVSVWVPVPQLLHLLF
ncbi:hypothetical protein D3C71_1221680 [compost metagenome]